MAKSLRELFKKKREGEKICMVSTYEYWSAKICEEAGIDCILVGDSLGMVIQGHSSTLPVKLEEVIYHTKAVRRGAPNTFLILDMPFMSYQTSLEEGLKNCLYAVKESGANAVKLEGGEEVCELVYKLNSFGIPTVGHIGFTPQYINKIGGYRVVGRKREEEEKLIKDFKALASAGAFMVILEMVPTKITKNLKDERVITIGIGAGKETDGQVLVFHDLMGLYREVSPKFVRRYLDGYSLMLSALKKFIIDVKEGNYPKEEESYE